MGRLHRLLPGDGPRPETILLDGVTSFALVRGEGNFWEISLGQRGEIRPHRLRIPPCLGMTEG
jgi:hypothetical protein